MVDEWIAWLAEEEVERLDIVSCTFVVRQHYIEWNQGLLGRLDVQMKFAELPETRKRAYEANERRLEVNVPVFSKMLTLRRKIASLLGYDSWADYATEVRMVKSAQGVFAFLAEVERRLRPVAAAHQADTRHGTYAGESGQSGSRADALSPCTYL